MARKKPAREPVDHPPDIGRSRRSDLDDTRSFERARATSGELSNVRRSGRLGAGRMRGIAPTSTGELGPAALELRLMPSLRSRQDGSAKCASMVAKLNRVSCDIRGAGDQRLGLLRAFPSFDRGSAIDHRWRLFERRLKHHGPAGRASITRTRVPPIGQPSEVAACRLLNVVTSMGSLVTSPACNTGGSWTSDG